MQDILGFLSSIECAKVISNDIHYSDYTPIDFSVTNEEFVRKKLETATDYKNYIKEYLELQQAKIAYGGYLETRNLYKRSTVFNTLDSDERNIHIGLDLWINESAPVYAALSGKIHSFQNNKGLGDYGPTLILEHHIENYTFYTLYGHLSSESLKHLKVGDFITQGEQIATLGLPSENGNYSQHLHFQIIIDMENKFGDYPGVCSSNKLDFYSKNCPDPNVLLKIY